MAGTRQRLISQYQNSVNLIALFEALIDNPMIAVLNGITPLYDLYDIDAMAGVQLDGIGKIIVQPRPNSFNNSDIYEEGVFTLGNNTDPQPEYDSNVGFGDTANLLVGGRFNSGATSVAKLNDGDYRLVLKGKIHANNTIGTVRELEQFGMVMFGKYSLAFPYAGGVLVLFPYFINSVAIEVVRQTLTVAKGVELILAIQPNPKNGKVFGFNGGANVGGFGSTSDSNAGYGMIGLV
jgi:hypothetical protein